MRTLISLLLLLTLNAFGAPQPTTYLNAWTTNRSVLPVFGDNNLSVSNRIAGAGGGTNWNFFGIGPATVARLKDATNIANAIVTNAIASSNANYIPKLNGPSDGQIATNLTGFNLSADTNNIVELGDPKFQLFSVGSLFHLYDVGAIDDIFTGDYSSGITFHTPIAGYGAGLNVASAQTNSQTLDIADDLTAYGAIIARDGFSSLNIASFNAGIKLNALTPSRLMAITSAGYATNAPFSVDNISNKIDNLSGNGTNLFLAVGTSNFFQQFFSTTTNTGGLLNQVAPWGMVQFSRNQQNGPDPHQDVQTMFGYNFNGSGAVINTNESMFNQTFESDWQNSANLIQSEWYLSYVYPYTNYAVRPFAFNFQRSTNTAPGGVLTGATVTGNINADSFSFEDRNQVTVPWLISMDSAGQSAAVIHNGQYNIRGDYLGNAGMTIGGSTDHAANGFLVVKNSAGTAGGEITMSGTSMLFSQTAGVTKFNFDSSAPVQIDGNYLQIGTTAGGFWLRTNATLSSAIEITSADGATGNGGQLMIHGLRICPGTNNSARIAEINGYTTAISLANTYPIMWESGSTIAGSPTVGLIGSGTATKFRVTAGASGLGSLQASNAEISTLLVTNGIGSYKTNWTADATSFPGFTNTTAYAQIWNVRGTSGNIVFWNRTGASGATACGTALWTNTVIASGEDITVGVNCGIAIDTGVNVIGGGRAF